jgi:hypothetical protein
MPSQGPEAPAYLRVVNNTIDAIAARPAIAEWLARRSPEQLRHLPGSAFRRIQSVLSDPNRTSLADSLRAAEAVANGTNRHLGADAHSPTKRSEIGQLAQLRSACRAFGENIRKLPMGQGAGNRVDVGQLEFYRGVLLHFVAQGFARPSPMDMADMSMYWELEGGERDEAKNRWRARLGEPWAKEIECGVDRLFGQFVGDEHGRATRESRYPSAATSFFLAML